MEYKLHANFSFVQINLHQITDCILFYVNKCSSITSLHFHGDFIWIHIMWLYTKPISHGVGGGSEPPTLNHPSTTNHPRQEKVLCLVCTDFTFKLIHYIWYFSCGDTRYLLPDIYYETLVNRFVLPGAYNRILLTTYLDLVPDTW